MDKHVEVSFPSDKKIFGDIQIPGSKSISNRYLILKHFSGQNISFDNLSSSEDTVLLIKNLKAVSENLHKGATLYCHHAGTTFRFLLSLLCITPGEWILDGSERLRQRPHGALVDALNSLGAHIKSLHEDYRPPYLIEGNDNLKGGVIEARSDISSQVISSLLLVGPCLKGGLKIKTTGEKVSGGYIELTVQCMKKFGVEVIEHESCLIIPEQKYMLNDEACKVESDWPSASYFYELLCLSDEGKLVLGDFDSGSLQPDRAVQDLFALLGIRSTMDKGKLTIEKILTFDLPDFFEYDFSNIPDIAMTAAVTCFLKKVPCRLSGLQTLNKKESERLNILARLFVESGAMLESTTHSLTIKTYSENFRLPYFFRVFEDHRMAMAFSGFSSLQPVMIENPEVVAKSYPGFWDALKTIGFGISFKK